MSIASLRRDLVELRSCINDDLIGGGTGNREQQRGNNKEQAFH